MGGLDGGRLEDPRRRIALRRDPHARHARGDRALLPRPVHALGDPRHGPALGRRSPARGRQALRRDLAHDGRQHGDDHAHRVLAAPRRRWLSLDARAARDPMTDRLRLAVPNKGRMVEPTLRLLHDAGLVFDEHDRSLVARVQNFDLDILFVRTNDIIEFVGDGVADLGITGIDLLSETGAELPRIRDLGYGRCRLAAAVPNDSPHRTVEDLAGLRVATAHPNSARRFFAGRGIAVDIVPISGAVEVAPRLGLAEAIV